MSKTIEEYMYIEEFRVFVETNVALNKTAQASSVYNSVYTADKAVDGIVDGTHGWSALIEDDSAWWQVDLGSAYNIKRVEIPARMGYDQYTTRRNFEIRASNDASMENYVVLGSVGSSGFPKDTTWTLNVSDPNSYRYLRLVKTDGAYMYIEEFRAFVETNLGLNKTAQASSIYNSSHTADKAVDGIVDGTHGWASSPAWWQVDLGSAYNIKRIEIPSRPVYDQIWSRRNFEIQASNNASMANYVVLGAIGNEGFSFDTTWTLNVSDHNSYRYLRIYKINGEYMYIEEVRVFGG